MLLASSQAQPGALISAALKRDLCTGSFHPGGVPGYLLVHLSGIPRYRAAGFEDITWAINET